MDYKVNGELEYAINMMVTKINEVLFGNTPSVYLYGSCVLDDFKIGWSDIDILVLTPKPIADEQAKILVSLRQTLLNHEPQNPYYHSFEGGMLSFAAFKQKAEDKVIYWGTSGQKIQKTYDFNSLCLKELIDFGILLSGDEIRTKLIYPTYKQVKADIYLHYSTIRKYAKETARSIYSYGWLLDISRCIYTLQTSEITSKTAAAKWALSEKICPVNRALQKALEVRKDPTLFQRDVNIQNDSERLGDDIQKYVDVLEQCLKKREN